MQNFTSPAALNNQGAARLPCRGCQASCANYENCQGMPWKYPRQLATDISAASTSAPFDKSIPKLV